MQWDIETLTDKCLLNYTLVSPFIYCLTQKSLFCKCVCVFPTFPVVTAHRLYIPVLLCYFLTERQWWQAVHQMGYFSCLIKCKYKSEIICMEIINTAVDPQHTLHINWCDFFFIYLHLLWPNIQILQSESVYAFIIYFLFVRCQQMLQINSIFGSLSVFCCIQKWFTGTLHSWTTLEISCNHTKTILLRRSWPVLLHPSVNAVFSVLDWLTFMVELISATVSSSVGNW